MKYYEVLLSDLRKCQKCHCLANVASASTSFFPQMLCPLAAFAKSFWQDGEKWRWCFLDTFQQCLSFSLLPKSASCMSNKQT